MTRSRTPVPAALARRALARVAYVLVALTVSAASRAQQPAVAPSDSSDLRPTIAVYDFTNGAVPANAEYGPLSKSLAEMLGLELARNPAIRVVERDRLQQVIAEQNLGAGDRVDPATAVRIGKLLGVHHLVFGGFAIQSRERRTRLWMRSVNAETGQLEYVESVEGKADQLFDLLDAMGRKINAGLKLPQLPRRERPANGGGRPGTNWLRAMTLMGLALGHEERGDAAKAIACYRRALEVAPDFDHAKVRLALLEGGRRPGQTP
jgi:TolB-like protein